MRIWRVLADSYITAGDCHTTSFKALFMFLQAFKSKRGLTRKIETAGFFVLFLCPARHAISETPVDTISRTDAKLQNFLGLKALRQEGKQRQIRETKTPIINDVILDRPAAAGDRILIKGLNLQANSQVFLGRVRLPVIPDPSAKGLLAVVTFQSITGGAIYGRATGMLTVTNTGEEGIVYTSGAYALPLSKGPVVLSVTLEGGRLVVHGFNLIGVTCIRVGQIIIPPERIETTELRFGSTLDEQLEGTLPAGITAGAIEIETALGNVTAQISEEH